MFMNTLDTPVSHRFHQALSYTSELHARQARKCTQIPYVSHLLAVAAIVWESGGTEEEAIAALLHDAGEDQGGEETITDIRARFGDEVADIVEHCSDTFVTPKPEWEQRKRMYVECLSKAGASTLLVSAADKLHNAQATLRDLEKYGSSVWDRFTPGRDGTLRNYDNLIKVYQDDHKDERLLPIVEELEATVKDMRTH